jgi:Family of unknown function (DUF6011)
MTKQTTTATTESDQLVEIGGVRYGTRWLGFRTRDLWGIPVGRYVLPVKVQIVDGNDLVWYRVKRFADEFGGHPLLPAECPDCGPWEECTCKILTRQDRAVPRKQAPGVLERVAHHGVEMSAKRAKAAIVHCEVCGAVLTSRASRERGVGPWCAEHRAEGETPWEARDRDEREAAERIAARRKAQRARGLTLVHGDDTTTTTSKEGR